MNGNTYKYALGITIITVLILSMVSIVLSFKTHQLGDKIERNRKEIEELKTEKEDVGVIWERPQYERDDRIGDIKYEIKRKNSCGKDFVFLDIWSQNGAVRSPIISVDKGEIDSVQCGKCEFGLHDIIFEENRKIVKFKGDLIPRSAKGYENIPYYNELTLKITNEANIVYVDDLHGIEIWEGSHMEEFIINLSE